MLNRLVAAFGIVGMVMVVTLTATQKAAPSGTIVLDQSAPQLGEWITFTTSISGLPGWADPRIQIVCEQNGQVVYGEAGPSTQRFLLGGASSPWLNSSDGADATQPAQCVATLYFWQFHPRQVFNPLASISFEAAGR